MKKVLMKAVTIISVFAMIISVASAAGARLRFSDSYGSNTARSGRYYPFVYDVSGYHCADNDAILHKSNLTYNSTLRDLAHGDLGAYYYAYSPMSTTFKEASAKIDISSISVDTKGVRNAFINLGYSSSGSVSSCWDIGIFKEGKNPWKIFVGPTSPGVLADNGYLDITWTSGSEKMTLPSGTSTVLFSITLGHTTDENKYEQITIVWDFINSSGQTFNTARCVITGKSNNSLFHTSDGKPFGRFYRFISLIPSNPYAGDESGYDVADGSYLNASLYDIRLNYNTWQDSNIQQAYSVQSANYSNLSIGGLSLIGPNTTTGTAGRDTIYIHHNTLLH